MQNELASRLKEVPGVISVGLGKKGGQIVLLVAVDSGVFNGGVPAAFEGIEIITRDLGKPRLFLAREVQ